MPRVEPHADGNADAVRGHAIARRSSLAAVIIAFSWPAPAPAQADSLGLHATLNGWAEDAWLTIADRDAAPGGRLSDLGILQRFRSTIDQDYQINRIRIAPDLLEEYTWYRRADGARFSGGSLNTREMGIEAEFKQSVPLGTRWSSGVHFTKHNLPDAVRSLVRLRFTRAAPSGAFQFIEGTLTPLKPSADIEAGAGWRRGDAHVTASVAVLDAFNNLIYQGLQVRHFLADTALDYKRQPVALRTSLDVPLDHRFRLEASSAVLRPNTVRAYVQDVPDSGFRQDEQYGFVGALFEWLGSPRLTAGGFATYVSAVTDRQPLPDGRPLDDFRLTERTTRAGAQLLARLARRWELQTWIGGMWRTERRVYRSAAAPDVDYEDASWSGQAELTYGLATGLVLTGALDFDDRRVVRGDGEVPAQRPLGEDNNEIRLNVGWRFPRGTTFRVGLGIDIDPGVYSRGWFGGAQGAFVLYW